MQYTQDQTAFLKLAQMHRCLSSHDSDETITQKICNKQGNNNYQLPSNNVKESMPEDLGNTVLHFVALKSNEAQTLDILLNNGADITAKNQAGLTPLHCIVNRDVFYQKSLKFFKYKNINCLLAAHIKLNNISNPCDNDGMSHFHVACMVNNVEVIEFFLKNGVSIDHTMNADSSHFPGYTSLHFAVKFCNLEAAETLLKHGADTCAKDTKGMTPLHVLIEDKMHIHNLINEKTEGTEVQCTWVNDLMDKIDKNERITNCLMQENKANDADFFNNVGLSRFHIACTMQDSSQVETLLDHITDIYHPLPENSSIWSGYTALHFAANCNVETAKVLMLRGADMEAKDAEGVTPFDICVSKHKIHDIYTILSYKLEWKYIQFLHSKMTLLDLLPAMQSSNAFGKFLANHEMNVSIPNNAPLWQGYTPLHLAVLFSERFAMSSYSKEVYPLIEECLSRGADVTIQDARGSSPLHLAFSQKKKRVVEGLLKSHYKAENPVDETGLSHLIIACAAGNKEVVEQLVNGANVNFAYSGEKIFYRHQLVDYGHTPLHIAVANEDLEIVQILLARGADVTKSSFGGLTPIHDALYRDPKIAVELLNSPDLKNCQVPGQNFSHLHVACQVNSLDAVRKLIDMGADVNAAIVYDRDFDTKDTLNYLAKCNNWTPLYFAVKYGALEIATLLIQNGADVLAKANDYDAGKNLNGSTPLSVVLKFRGNRTEEQTKLLALFVETIENDESLQKRMEEDFGITMLHLACHFVDLEKVKKLMKGNVDVNAKVHEDSAIWPGCTPLHVLIMEIEVGMHKKGAERNADKIVKMMVSGGADVTLGNVDGDTPVHLSFLGYKAMSSPAQIRYRSQIRVPKHSRVKMLMKGHKNFDVNPINEEGISHFHIAVATDDLDAATKFIQQKVDVNHATNYFNSCAAGYTALHYAVDLLAHKTFSGSPDYCMVYLLLSHGADVNLEDVCGNTPLHLAVRAKVPRDDLLRMLMRRGADCAKRNSYSQTPLELMLE